MTEPNVIMIVDEDYMANLLTEELCGDCSPLVDLRVSKVSPQSTGSFRIEMTPKEPDAANG